MHIHSAAIGAALLAIAMAPAAAQEPAPFDLVPEAGPHEGVDFTVDAAFAEEHGIVVPAPFAVRIPTADDVKALVEPAPESGGGFIKVEFATPELELIEDIQFFPMTLAMGEPELRAQTLGDILFSEAFPTVIAGYQQNELNLLRKTTVGNLVAVEVIGNYTDPDIGRIFVRIVGIPNPNGPDSVFTVATVVARKLDVPSPEAFSETRGGTMLKYFRYLE